MEGKDGINHVGRITKGAAYGLKARAALYAKRWQDAVDACDEVFKLEKKGVHALLGKNQYNDIFTVPNNKELLLTVNYEKMKLQHSFNLNCCPALRLQGSRCFEGFLWSSYDANRRICFTV